MMKPRPIISLRLPIHTNRSVSGSQCRRQSTAPFLRIYNRPQTSLRAPPHPSQAFLRYASSAATVQKPQHSPTTKSQAVVPSKSPSSTVPIPQVRAKLNPPAETYAPDLNLPARKKDQAYVKYLYHCGRSYIQFYKSGISNVRATSKIAKQLRQKARDAVTKNESKGAADEALTRAEWQIVGRSKSDMFRLPAFGALVLIFGEWLPLFVMYITPLIPEPCRIPAQVERSLKKLEQRRQDREKRLAIDAARLVSRDRKPGGTPLGIVRPQAVRIEELQKTDLYTLLSLSTKLDCHARAWDWLFLTPPKGLLRWSVTRKVEYVQKDDRLIERDGGWQALEAKEIGRACVERGIKVLGRGEAEQRRELAHWFKR